MGVGRLGVHGLIWVVCRLECSQSANMLPEKKKPARGASGGGPSYNQWQLESEIPSPDPDPANRGAIPAIIPTRIPAKSGFPEFPKSRPIAGGRGTRTLGLGTLLPVPANHPSSLRAHRNGGLLVGTGASTPGPWVNGGCIIRRTKPWTPRMPEALRLAQHGQPAAATTHPASPHRGNTPWLPSGRRGSLAYVRAQAASTAF